MSHSSADTAQPVPPALPARAAAIIDALGLRPHPEGGFYAEAFRSTDAVDPQDGRPRRAALTSIDFLLVRGQWSAWHRVQSDEVWHLLEGGPLRLWLLPPTLDALQQIDLLPATATSRPRQVVPAGWWQAAEPLADFAYAGATVGPGFDFADFTFGRDHPDLRRALAALARQAERLL